MPLSCGRDSRPARAEDAQDCRYRTGWEATARFACGLPRVLPPYRIAARTRSWLRRTRTGKRWMSKQHETLARIGLLRSLDAKARANFEGRSQWRHARAKEWLLEQNDIGTDIYF